jgi:hypothetical protein
VSGTVVEVVSAYLAANMGYEGCDVFLEIVLFSAGSQAADRGLKWRVLCDGWWRGCLDRRLRVRRAVPRDPGRPTAAATSIGAGLDTVAITGIQPDARISSTGWWIRRPADPFCWTAHRTVRPQMSRQSVTERLACPGYRSVSAGSATT